MSKAHRGTGIRKDPAKYPNHGRGTCPICGKNQVKVLYEKDVDGKKVKICKVCNAHLKNVARVEARSAKKAAATEKPAEAASEQA